MRLSNLSCLLVLAACAQDVGDVDRTQPNRIKKSVFDGEWYLLRTTFDVPYSAGFTFTGETSELERVRWQVEEHYLIAYRSYDRVEDTHQANLLPDVVYKGSPVAAYPISEHFDIVRDYNAMTGEETNVIHENAEDRPWNERDFIRVDWSKNLVAGFSFLDEQVSQSPINYYVQDRSDADRLLLGVRTGEQWTDHQDWEEIAKLETADYIDVVDAVFANPTTETFDDGAGGTFQLPACWFYGAEDCQPSRVKIRSSFLKIDPNDTYESMPYPDNAIARDATGKALRDPETNEAIRIPWFDKFGYFRVERDRYDRERELTETARTYLINRWSIWKDAPACKQDESYAGCTVRPIVYYLSPGFPQSLVAEARRGVAQWNTALKEVVNQLKYGGTRALSEIDDVFILRDSSYLPTQRRGERIGDVRYSFVYYVDDPQPTSVAPLGYGPSAADPLTGRIVQASAYVYGAGLEAWATQGADIVGLLNGTLPAADFIEGEDVRAYVARTRASAGANRGRGDRARDFAASELVTEGRKKQRHLGRKKMKLDTGKIRAKLAAIEDTPLEARLLPDELVRALAPQRASEPSFATLSPAERRAISPARWGTTGALRALEAKRRLKIQKNNLYRASFVDDAVVALAERLKDAGSREVVRQRILERVFASTAEHEIGHTLGLRHNFAGSYDALNYPAEYWQLRGNRPEPFAEWTDDQLREGIRELQYASIMDYGARFTSDIHGLGKYDQAAIHFGYGKLVQVFESEAAPTDPLAELVGLPAAFHDIRHYTSYPRFFGGDAAKMHRRKLVPYDSLVQQMSGTRTAEWVEVPFRFCSDEYDGTQSWCNTFDEGADPFEIVRNVNDAYEAYYIFNSFARDRRDIQPWDQFSRALNRYFIHPQIQYQHWVYEGWDESDFYDILREDPRRWQVQNVAFDRAVDGGLAGAAASQLGLNFLARVIQSPEPGAYYRDEADGVFYNYTKDQDVPLCPPGQSRDDCSDLNVGLGEGKYASSLYDAASGYYFFERLRVVGSFYDKLAALQTITSPETNFLGVDSDANLTQYAISMHLYFPDAVTRLVGGAAVESYRAFAGVMDEQKYRARDMFAPLEDYSGLAPVDPATSLTIELYAAWLGMAFLNANYDNSFNDLMQVWVEGNGEGQTPSVADAARVARYVHPRTGRTFMAVRAEDAGRFSPAFDLVTRTASVAANPMIDRQAKEYFTEMNVSILETLRGLHGLYGKLYF